MNLADESMAGQSAARGVHWAHPGTQGLTAPKTLSRGSLVSKMSHFKAVTLGNAFLLAKHHDTSPQMELLGYLELNLQVGSAIAELSIFIHYTSPQASSSACFAETWALFHAKKNSFFKLRGNTCIFTFLHFGNSTSKQ